MVILKYAFQGATLKHDFLFTVPTESRYLKKRQHRRPSKHSREATITYKVSWKASLYVDFSVSQHSVLNGLDYHKSFLFLLKIGVNLNMIKGQMSHEYKSDK